VTIERPGSAKVHVAELAPGELEAAIPGLAELILDAVAGGASVNFMADVTFEDASAWWWERAAQVRDGTITVFVARDPPATTAGGLVGCAMLIRSPNQNSPHRAEVAKVLVRQSVRRRGLGRALMEAAETRARADGRWLLILDTEADTPADRFYRSLGWTVLGTMPNHAYRSNGVLAPTTYYYKDLRG
jgi:GNAT superfamily N-acetyltransferase